MDTKWLNDFLRSMFEQFRAQRTPLAEPRPRLLPEAVKTELRHPEPENEVLKVAIVTDSVVPMAAPTFTRHTYLFDESVWLVSGVYINEKSVSVDVEGDSVITHRSGCWFNELNMELKAENSAQYRNLQYKTVYEYSPIGPAQGSSVWHASNALLGRLQGVLLVVDDTILSSYQNASGNIRGIEALRRISEYEYQCRGALFEAGKRSSSWILSYDKG